MEQLGIDFNATGSVMSKTELEELRRKRGECIMCGRKCFQKKLFKMIPITDHGRVLNGRCLNCKPLNANENEGGLIPAVSRPATKEDLARFSRSQSNLGGGPGIAAPVGSASAAARSPSRRQSTSRTHSGSDSNRSLPSSSASSGRQQVSRSASNSSAQAAVASSSRSRPAAAEVMDSSSARGTSARRSAEARRDRSLTPTNSQRPVMDASTSSAAINDMESSSRLQTAASSRRRPSHIDNGMESSSREYAAADVAHARRRPSHQNMDASLREQYADPQNDYNAGRQAVNEELHHEIEQMGIYGDEHLNGSHRDGYSRDLSQRSFQGDGPASRRGVSRHHSGDSNQNGHPRHGSLDRGGAVPISSNNTPSANHVDHPGSSRTMSSRGSVDDDIANEIVDPHQRGYYEDDIGEGGGIVMDGDEEHALDRLHAADGDCAEILAVMTDYPNSPLVQSFALKEISCLHLGPDDQDRLAQLGAMDLMLDAMHAYLDDIELQIHGCRAIWNASGTPENQIAFVTSGALDIILADMDRFIDEAEVQECAMGTLSNLAAAEENLLAMVEKGTVERVVDAMNKHSENSLVQAKGCSTVTNMASHLSPLKKDIMDLGGGSAVVICMVMHPDDFDLQEKALRALKNLSSNNDDNKVGLADIGAIDAVITAMQVHRDQPGVQEAGAWTLSNLASNIDNKAVIGDCGGIDVVIRAMWVHSDDGRVQEWCCRALYTLTLDRHNGSMVLQVGGISAVVNAMQAHVDSPSVQEMGCAVLCNLAFDESSKMRIVDEEALDAIVLAMVLFSDDGKVQESACEALLQLAIVENFKSMQASNVGELARAAASKFPENCKDPAGKLLHVLDGYCEQY